MRKVRMGLSLCLAATSAYATPTQTLWGTERTVSPQNYGVFDANNVFRPAFTLAATGGGQLVWLGSVAASGLTGLGTGVSTALGNPVNTTAGLCTVGTSGAFCPLLNGINTWSSAQTYTALMTLGTGTYAPTANYAGGTTTTALISAIGSIASPSTSADAIAIWQKNSNKTTAGLDVTTYTSCTKNVSTSTSSCTANFNEAIDRSGGTGSFVEGARAHGFVTGGTLGSGYGAVTSGGTGPNVTYQYIVGNEGNTENHSGADSLAWLSFNKNSFSAAFVATNVIAATAVDNKSDVAFLTNPYSTKPYRTGFGCFGNDGTQVGVDDSCFAAKGTVPYGLNLVNGTYSTAAVLLPNLGIVRARNAAANADHNILYYDASNNLVLGTDAAQINLPAPVFASKGLQSTGAYTGAFTDGIVLDYVTGTARISAGTSDGVTFFNGGVGGVNIGAITPAGEFTTTNHYLTQAAVPAASACGTSPTVTAGSSNHGGQFTTGTAAPTACTITFASAFPNTAFCTIHPANAAAAGATVLAYLSTTSNTGFIVTMAVGTNSAKFNYVCMGN